jgi:hypothetical protein
MNGQPDVVSSCCCEACQRRSGSLVSVQAFYGVEQVEAVSGASQIFERIGESGKKITYHFCAACGATLYWMPELRAGKIAVAVGAFADQNFPAPERLVWTDFRHPWVQVPQETKQYPGNAP